MASIEPRNAKLDLRLSASAKQTLQAAARLAHRSVRELVLESALLRAEKTLPESRISPVCSAEASATCRGD
ncbi:MAG: DUF1778 domain-containing protein [Acidobacteria bacterium]|nr:DUF1778 domain-containing protein [Acidobacteriota bacterium]